MLQPTTAIRARARETIPHTLRRGAASSTNNCNNDQSTSTVFTIFLLSTELTGLSCNYGSFWPLWQLQTSNPRLLLKIANYVSKQVVIK